MAKKVDHLRALESRAKTNKNLTRPGRPKGTPNKIGAQIKKSLFETFEELGGKDYLAAVAVDYPTVFCNLLGKLVPAEIKAEIGRVSEFDRLSDEELDAAIKRKFIELGVDAGRERVETVLIEPDTVHEEDSPELQSCDAPPADSGSVGESRAG